MNARHAALLTTIILLTTSTSAKAAEVFGVDLGVGLRGGPNLSLMNKPAGASVYGDTPYETYHGGGWNVGAALNLRLFDLVAFEAGYLYASESVSGTIELQDVRDCRWAPSPCLRQEYDQRFSRRVHHVPLVLQASLPTGIARPFVSLGVDVVFKPSNRTYEVTGRSRLPDELDPNDEGDAALLDLWARSARGQAGLNATVSNNTDDVYAGLVAGIGVDIVLERIEIPVEFRLHLYPASGATIDERGDFAGPCTTEDCAYDPARPAPAYNDIWTTQFFVLFGLDYRIF
jgi:hypothetical protein